MEIDEPEYVPEEESLSESSEGSEEEDQEEEEVELVVLSGSDSDSASTKPSSTKRRKSTTVSAKDTPVVNISKVKIENIAVDSINEKVTVKAEEVPEVRSPSPSPEPSECEPVPQFRFSTKTLLGESEFLFCPRCHNLLCVSSGDEDSSSSNRYNCLLCPYYVNVTRKYVHPLPVEKRRKVLEDGIIDLDKQNARRQKTEVICPKCTNTEAYYYQMQTRSADEPMTTFYECTNKECRNNWRD